MAKNRRQPKRAYTPVPSKIPVAVPVSTSGLSVHWSFALFDGSVDWHTDQHKEETFREAAQHMRDYEGLTWGQIENRRKYNHPVPIGALIPKARNRLRTIKQDDIDELWRFRFGGKPRI